MTGLDRLVDLLEQLLDDRQTVAVGPAEAGRRLCPEQPISADVVRGWVNAGVLGKVPHTARICIPVTELKRFAESGLRTSLRAVS